ncbi:MAG: succinylglutamate desuccinylase/aspartoacylase family protein [Candidatus Dormiibacterota bacterium]
MSQRTMHVGTATAGPGRKARGVIAYGTDAMHQTQGIPVVVAHGAKPGPRLWVNAGTHGDEAEGALALFLLLEQLDLANLAGTLVAVPMLNPAAFMAGTRGDPLDTFSYDLNRIYPGRADGYVTERLAHAHWEAMRTSCDLQISIHSGGDHSYLSHMIFAAENGQELARAMGVGWRLIFGSATGTGNPTSQLAAEGIPAITVELGGLCRTLTKEFREIAEEYCSGLINVMRHYRMLPGDASYERQWQLGHQVAILAPVGGLFVGVPDLQFESPVEAGSVLGRIYNCYGDLAAEIRAPEAGLVFGLRSRPQVRTGEWCCFFGVIEGTTSDPTGAT